MAKLQRTWTVWRRLCYVWCMTAVQLQCSFGQLKQSTLCRPPPGRLLMNCLMWVLQPAALSATNSVKHVFITRCSSTAAVLNPLCMLSHFLVTEDVTLCQGLHRRELEPTSRDPWKRWTTSSLSASSCYSTSCYRILQWVWVFGSLKMTNVLL